MLSHSGSGCESTYGHRSWRRFGGLFGPDSCGCGEVRRIAMTAAPTSTPALPSSARPCSGPCDRMNRSMTSSKPSARLSNCVLNNGSARGSTFPIKVRTGYCSPAGDLRLCSSVLSISPAVSAVVSIDSRFAPPLTGLRRIARTRPPLTRRMAPTRSSSDNIVW
jgi:hypothetical protein